MAIYNTETMTEDDWDELRDHFISIEMLMKVESV